MASSQSTLCGWVQDGKMAFMNREERESMTNKSGDAVMEYSVGYESAVLAVEELKQRYYRDQNQQNLRFRQWVMNTFFPSVQDSEVYYEAKVGVGAQMITERLQSGELAITALRQG